MEDGRWKIEGRKNGWGLKPQLIVNTPVDGGVLNPKEKDNQDDYL